jgi:beta-lactam-binding protein with PASTA domain
VSIADSIAPKGQVFSQSPSGGSVIPLGTLVEIQISTGVPAMIEVPRVVTLPVDEAVALLRSLGLSPAIVKVDTRDPNKVGVVINQDPNGRTTVEQGTTVTIFVGSEQKGNGAGNGNGNGGGND